MTGIEFIANINYIDDSFIFEAENWVRHKAYKIRYMVGAAISAACLCLAIVLTVNYARCKISPNNLDGLEGCPMLPGSDKIYPTIMVDNTLYEWRLGVALVDELPIGSTYYGKINHTSRTTPEKDCELVSVFPASGRIFVNHNEDLVYLELTTDWLENQLVIFEPISMSERYQYEMGLITPE